METNKEYLFEKEKFLITSVSNLKNAPKTESVFYNIDEPKKTTTNTTTTFSFPKIKYITSPKYQRNDFYNFHTNYSNYKQDKKKKYNISLKDMELFINPINKSVLETDRLKTIKNNLVKKKFNELHKYKLQINPNNYYRSFGLNNFVVITNKNSKNNSNSCDYRFNNVSSYNNILLKKEENKVDTISSQKILYKNIKIKKLKNNFNLLKNVPYRIKNKKSDDHIINSFNEEKGLVNVNSLWRGKNINDIIHNKTNLNFFKNFIKNSRYIGKINSLK